MYVWMLSGDSWTATFSKLPKTKWWKRHFINFDFVSEQRCFLHSQPSVCSAGLSFLLCSFVCLFGQFGNGNEYKESLRYNSFFISSPLSTEGHKTTS